MTKYFLLSLTLGFWAFAILACKNDKPNATKTTELPAPKTDSLVGFKGCDRAGFLATTAKKHEFRYQHYQFQVIDSDEVPGDRLEARIDSTGAVMRVPDVEATYFRGFSLGHFFVDIGNDPYVRDVIVYSLRKGVLSQVYRTPYIVADTPFVANGTFWFYRPVEEDEVPEDFECPEKDKGKKVTYGQRYMYHIDNRGLTRKSEYICAPLED